MQIEIDKADSSSWERVLAQFDDASFYQTWAYGTAGGGRKSVSHLVAKEGEEVLGCCQVAIRRLPSGATGFADVKWGPLCVKTGGRFNPDVLVRLLHEIKEEYAQRRGLLLRVWPHATRDRQVIWKTTLESESFRLNQSERPYRTLMLDVSPPLEELRKNLLQKWRNCLNKAEKNELVVLEGTSDELFRTFQGLAAEMRERKNLGPAVDYEEYRRIQQDLPASAKMQIMICQHNGEPVAAAICSVLGNTAIYMLGATGQKGLGLNGSYLLQWRMIEWMKAKGVRYYDLGAFNPELNPSVYHFKLGVAGKSGWEETFLGNYLGAFNWRGRLAETAMHLARILRRSA